MPKAARGARRPHGFEGFVDEGDPPVGFQAVDDFRKSKKTCFMNSPLFFYHPMEGNPTGRQVRMKATLRGAQGSDEANSTGGARFG